MVKIYQVGLYNILQSPYALSTNQVDFVVHALYPPLSNQQTVLFDLSEMQVCSALFCEDLFFQLYRRFDVDFINHHLKFDLDQPHRDILKQMIANAQRAREKLKTADWYPKNI